MSHTTCNRSLARWACPGNHHTGSDNKKETKKRPNTKKLNCSLASQPMHPHRAKREKHTLLTNGEKISQSTLNETYGVGLSQVGNEESKLAGVRVSRPQYRVCILDNIAVNKLMLFSKLWTETTQISTVYWIQWQLVRNVQCRATEATSHTPSRSQITSLTSQITFFQRSTARPKGRSTSHDLRQAQLSTQSRLWPLLWCKVNRRVKSQKDWVPASSDEDLC